MKKFLIIGFLFILFHTNTAYTHDFLDYQIQLPHTN